MFFKYPANSTIKLPTCSVWMYTYVYMYILLLLLLCMMVCIYVCPFYALFSEKRILAICTEPHTYKPMHTHT